MYILFYFVIGAATFGSVFVIWVLVRLTLLGVGGPSLHFKEYVTEFTPAPLKGFFYAIGPMGIMALLIQYLFIGGGQNYFKSINAQWNQQTTETDVQKEFFAGGRCGVALVGSGLAMMMFGTKLLVPYQDGGENGGSTSDYRPYYWQRSHIMFLCVGATILVLFIVEFSYTVIFSTHTAAFLFMFKVLFVGVEIVLSKLLSEKILIAPFMLAFGVVQFTITLGADGFLSYIQANLIELTTDIVKRVLADPIKFQVTSRLKRKAALQAAALAGLPPPDDIPEEIVMRGNLVSSLYLFYANNLAMSFAPFAIMFMFMFRGPLFIVEFYGILDREMLYYFYYASFMIPTQAVCDVFL